MPKEVRIAKKTKSVFSTNPNDFIFHSKYNTFKIIATGTTSATISATGQEVTVAHGKSYVPGLFAFCKFDDDLVALPGESQKNGANNIDRWFYAEADGTNLIFRFLLLAGSSYAVVIRYYIFEVPASV